MNVFGNQTRALGCFCVCVWLFKTITFFEGLHLFNILKTNKVKDSWRETETEQVNIAIAKP